MNKRSLYLSIPKSFISLSLIVVQVRNINKNSDLINLPIHFMVSITFTNYFCVSICTSKSKLWCTIRHLEVSRFTSLVCRLFVQGSECRGCVRLINSLEAEADAVWVRGVAGLWNLSAHFWNKNPIMYFKKQIFAEKFVL